LQFRSQQLLCVVASAPGFAPASERTSDNQWQPEREAVWQLNFHSQAPLACLLYLVTQSHSRSGGLKYPTYAALRIFCSVSCHLQCICNVSTRLRLLHQECRSEAHAGSMAHAASCHRAQQLAGTAWQQLLRSASRSPSVRLMHANARLPVMQWSDNGAVIVMFSVRPGVIGVTASDVQVLGVPVV
jgi:hypothetical protein